MATAHAFPSFLAWVERGSVLVRRMNSERIAEDPRLRRILRGDASVDGEEKAAAPGSVDATGGATGAATAGDTCSADAVAGGEAPAETARDSFERVEAATDSDDIKQQSDNSAPQTFRVLLWTYRVHASLQHALQYALFAKASDDGYFVPIAPRVFCVAPAYLTTFTKLFDAHSSSRQWNAALKLLSQLDSIIAKRYEMGACVFDCGLFDGVKRQHHKPLVDDEFCDGRIASITYTRGPVPSMHAAFVVASTVAAWLDLQPSNVAILVAPNNEQMSVFATCCAMYCTDATSFPANFARELLEVYQQHIRGSESWPTKLSRTFSGLDAKNVYYAGGNVPKPQARFVADFSALLEMRDHALSECLDAPEIRERREKLTGVTIAPAPQQLYVHEIRLLPPDNSSSRDAATDTDSAIACASDGTMETTATASKSQSVAAIRYRPYFVFQSEKGVLFSSLIHGVRDVNLAADGPHVFKVHKTLEQCSEFALKMYHLPFGRQGELVLDARLHAILMLHAASARSSASDSTSGPQEITLAVDNGDFDCISAFHALPKGFKMQIWFGHSASAFPPPPPASTAHSISDDDDQDAASLSSTSSASAATAASASTAPHRSSFTAGVAARNNPLEHRKSIRYEGPRLVSFLLGQRDVRTAFGDVVLQRIHLYRRATSSEVELFLLFSVELPGVATSCAVRLLPYRLLFRYVLPDEVRSKMLAMGATEESLNATAPSSFDVGTGMTFDEEYARWLQHIYDTELNNPSGVIEGELSGATPAADLVPTNTYRTELCTGSESSSVTTGQASTENVGDEVKSLPCFHSYHTECIDSWLCLNKVCPVCQFSVDQVEAASTLLDA
ncbi:hypothetical protein P43SY_002739 [Pythium insidiosum]|uniref:RING-type E3 ubiquitin transferase n=1 Tax=Pythium insidiosum TaxID=114742 RepID=A0AAD5LUM9_PYTIN|nr:hypothetical protein P43SY_002739 [Pythium insidiosum]